MTLQKFFDFRFISQLKRNTLLNDLQLTAVVVSLRNQFYQFSFSLCEITTDECASKTYFKVCYNSQANINIFSRFKLYMVRVLAKWHLLMAFVE